MKKPLVVGLALAALVTVFAANAYSWNYAVHVYIADQLKGTVPSVMYAATAPDLFNYAFAGGVPQSVIDVVYGAFHDTPEALWAVTGGDALKMAFAYGFICHGQSGGADTMAHLHGVRFGKLEGYVIGKAAVLDAILQRYPKYRALKRTAPPVALAVTHNIIEAGLDVLLRRKAPDIGDKIIAAAAADSTPLRDMIAVAYPFPADLMAAVLTAEAEYKTTLLAPYGIALKYVTSDADLIDGLALQMAAFAPAYVAGTGVEITPEEAYPIIKYGMQKTMIICQGTFFKELAAMVAAVKVKMADFSY